MAEAALVKVALGLVHKEFEDDVLIANMRSLLPSWLPATALEATSLAASERSLLRQAYCTPLAADAQGTCRVGLRSLPATLTPDRLSTLRQEALRVIARHYERRGAALDLVTAYLPELDHVILMNHVMDRAVHLSDADRYALSMCLDKLDGLDRPNAMCFNMVLDTENYYFYRKHHEHVPGIMLIEVIRQAMYAHYYHSGKLPRGEVSLTIENLNVDFTGFVNANYPVRIQVEDPRTPAQLAASRREEPVAVISQLGRVVARAQLRAQPIRMRLFKRLRDVHPSPRARFVPTKNIAPVGMFDLPGRPDTEGLIRDLSTGGLKAAFAPEEAPQVGDTGEFWMFVAHTGFLHARVQARWSLAEGEHRLVGFAIAAIDAHSLARLREVIKNCTFIDTERGEL